MTGAQRPHVSVVLPTFDRVHSLGRAIESVLDQSYADLELVVVDDGSRDHTAALVAGIGDPRVVSLRNEANQGYARAFNRGLAAARGELVAFQDSDDVWLPGKLARQVEVLVSDPGAGVVYTACNRVFDRGTGAATERLPPAWAVLREGSLGTQLLLGNSIGASTALVRAPVLEEAGDLGMLTHCNSSRMKRLFPASAVLAGGAGVERRLRRGTPASEFLGLRPEAALDERLPCLQDWDLWLTLARRARFRFIDEPLVTVHYTKGGVNDACDTTLAAALQGILERHADAFAACAPARAKHEHAVGHLLFRSGNLAEGRSWLLRAARSESRPKHLLRAAVSFLGVTAYRAAGASYARLRAQST